MPNTPLPFCPLFSLSFRRLELVRSALVRSPRSNWGGEGLRRTLQFELVQRREKEREEGKEEEKKSPRCIIRKEGHFDHCFRSQPGSEGKTRLGGLRTDNTAMARLLRAARLPASWPSGVDLRALCSSSGSSRPGPSQMELPSMAQRAREKTEEVLRQLSLDRV